MKKNPIILYPFIFSLASSLYLYQRNVFEVNFLSVLRTLIVITAFTILVYLINKQLFRQSEVAGILTSAMMLIFTIFGSMNTYFAAKITFGNPQDLTMGLELLMVLILFGLLVLVIKKPDIRKKLHEFLVLSSVAFLALLIAGFAITFLRSWINVRTTTEPDVTFGSSTEQDALPDIYFIVLDAYTSRPVLQEDFQFDNSGFLNSLRDMGFVVIDDSYSNFDGTVYSLSTILNMDYAQNFIDSGLYDPGHRVFIDKSINNEVRKILSGYGYHFTAFSSDFPWLLWRDADYLLEPVKSNFLVSGINQFEYLVIRGSIFSTILSYDPSFLDKLGFWFGRMGDEKYAEQLYLMNHLSEVPHDGSPMFVYAHSTITHTPFLFHADGSMIRASDQGSYLSDFTAENMKQSYLETIQFANKQILPQLAAILEKEPNSIIILLGDHGYPGEDQNAILFAIYDPRNSIESRECFTSINIFPSIFNRWFGMDLDLFQGDIYKTLDQKTNSFELLKSCPAEE